MENSKSVIQEISSTATFAVRHPILRVGKPLSSCRFEGDELISTKHFGLFQEGVLVGVISLFENKNLLFDREDQFQIRGMAVLENHQKKNYGRLLVQTVESFLKTNNSNFIWFNARIIAIGFYQKLGYQIVGLPFEIGDVGTHYVMFKVLNTTNLS